MEEDLRKLIKENRTLLLENREILQDNQQRIKKIQAHIRRTMIGKTIYWIVIIAVTVGALYFSKPYINSAIETYQDTRDSINSASQYSDIPRNYFKDVDIVNRIQEFFAEE